jgi:hypothetical protein
MCFISFRKLKHTVNKVLSLRDLENNIVCRNYLAMTDAKMFRAQPIPNS